jgi:hypothetical protein
MGKTVAPPRRLLGHLEALGRPQAIEVVEGTAAPGSPAETRGRGWLHERWVGASVVRCGAALVEVAVDTGGAGPRRRRCPECVELHRSEAE